MIEVVAAIIYYQNKILCFQKPKGKYKYISLKYEFPGGKVEQGESLVDALKREIKEELCADISIYNKLITIEHSYPDFSIKMHCYKCEIDTLDVVLNEHIDLKILDPLELKKLNWVEADIEVVNLLIGD
jgi:8-oxo-dGTP diphosphatase